MMIFKSVMFGMMAVAFSVCGARFLFFGWIEDMEKKQNELYNLWTILAITGTMSLLSRAFDNFFIR